MYRNISFSKKALLSLGFFCYAIIPCNGQDKSERDSLKNVYLNKKYQKGEKLSLLRTITQLEPSADTLLIYSEELIKQAKKAKESKFIYSGYLEKGNAFSLKSDLSKALEAYFSAAQIALDNNFEKEQATIKISIADAYSIMGDNTLAVRYYRESIGLLERPSLLQELNDSINLATAELNLGDEYYNQRKLDSALYYFERSEKLFELTNHDLGAAYNLGNIGLVYAEMGENLKAEENLNSSIKVLTDLGDYYPICEYLLAMSNVYLDRGQTEEALRYANRSLELATEYSSKELISESNLALSNIYENEGMNKLALDNYKSYVSYRDSVKSLEDIQESAAIRTEFYVSQKQVELDLEKEERKNQQIISIAIGVALILIAGLAFLLFKRNSFMKKTNKIIEMEKQRSDDLLLNILPVDTANELKVNGSVKAKRFDQVSVLFTDFKGFTKFSENLTPEELVRTIDFYFSKFDEIIEKHGLEKIKTVGDAYMCAAGLPYPDDLHYLKITLAALDISKFVEETMNDAYSQTGFDIRIGINSGSVVAGVVGTKKFAYDIWGDTVNVASRMESSGEVGRVNISQSTFALLANHEEFKFESRGAIEAKGKGKIEMYFVDKKEIKEPILN